MKLRNRLLLSKLGLAALPATVIGSLLFWQSNGALSDVSSKARTGFEECGTQASQALEKAGTEDLAHVAQAVHSMCQAQQELLQQKLEGDLRSARFVLSQVGVVQLAGETVEWEAVNQFSKQASKVTLPKMSAGSTWLGQNAQMSVPSPVVDQVRDLTAGTCTIFQRMNPAGDMLRVCTNVPASGGGRAVGTFIPALMPEGTPNLVVQTVLKGETYRGRTRVMDAWYITAYEPLRSSSGDVVGMLYVGVKEESAESLRKAIMATQVGKTGYVFVLNAKAPTRGHYVISKDGQRDGQDISTSKDAAGKLFIQDMCDLALGLKPGEVGELRYSWQNQGEAAPREKIAKIAYFQPWDWLIGVGAYQDEFMGPVRQMNAMASSTMTAVAEHGHRAAGRMVLACVTGLSVTLLAAVAVAYVVTRGITRPIDRIVSGLTESAAQVASAASQMASTAQTLAQGAGDQASSLEETSSALEEMTATTRTNADSSGQANALAAQARDAANSGEKAMGRLHAVMNGINESSDEVSKIIRVIEEIAFQTNLLALNAAVEAARAGEHGKGFAVVAEEVRSLAMRAAQAAKQTTGLIENSVRRARDGAQVSEQVSGALTTIVSDVSRVTDLIDGIARATREQSQGAEEISTAVHQVDKITQQNAAAAEESASAAQEVAAQIAMVGSMIGDLNALVWGRSKADAAPDPAGAPAATVPA